MLYLDTSALLKLYILEQGSEAVQARVAAQDLPLPIWEIQEAELTNALRLKVFWKEITPAQADTQIGLFEQRRRQGFYHFPEIVRNNLMNTFRQLSVETPRLGCRTMDLFHVACAVEIGATEFLTFDRRQGSLAAHAGLRVGPGGFA
ncbi:MAG: type II toxin-antitoxin system VapC family toxin [Verrucomicrobia bacterium]|nr:MAG: type II toxin-antitoxin system VapC family toxin [Verrucomicrobiota bacterium]